MLLKFDETSDRWEFTNNGSTYYNIPISSEYNAYVHPTQTAISLDAASDAWGAVVRIDTDSTGHVTSAVKGGISTVTASSTVEGLVELATVTEVKAGSATNRAVTPAGIASLSYVASIGNGVLTSVPVTHNLGTRDVSVQVYDTTTFDTIYVETVRTTTAVVTLEFTTAPTTNKYRVVITRVAG